MMVLINFHKLWFTEEKCWLQNGGAHEPILTKFHTKGFSGALITNLE